MTAHSSILGLLPAGPAAVHPARYPLPADNIEDFARDVVVFTLGAEDLGPLMDRAQHDLPGLASRESVLRVMAHNPDSVWGIARREESAKALRPEGFIGFLMLNRQGVRRLIAGTFDASNPDITLLSGQNERPAGIYVWAMWARHNLVAGIPLAFEKMWIPLYQGADLYARAVTQDGRRLLETMGFVPGAAFENLTNHGLHSLYRSERHGANVPSYDRYNGNRRPEKAIAVTVARSIEDLMRIVSIRSAVYLGEQECPYLEEFDGNDFSSTHLIGYVGNEPAGCLRIRCFADFAKIERLAVRREFRKKQVSLHLVEAAIDLCQAKGYQRLYGHAQKRLVKFWTRFGFETFPGGQELVFSDFDYVEMQMFTTRRPNAITIGVDPYLILRPEGKWHQPGILEQSRSRPVTRPSVKRGAA